ncbi:MAG: hypothetical protein HY238_25445, partial [Acidobacteria bacterium]|nr:hypothetical protein [Acidobacteriota bacterium]
MGVLRIVRTLVWAGWLAALAAAQTMSIEEYQPRSTLVTPQHPKPRAKYPFIDVHGHPRRTSVDRLL